jgi:hypothetical protein
LELVERLRFRLRPVRESKVEAEDEGTTKPVTADVNDCGAEDEEVPMLDNSDDDDANVDVLDDCVVLVAPVVEGFRARASPMRRATPSSAANTTERLWFKPLR